MQQKVYFDLTVLANTAAGSAVLAWELCHRLMRLSQPLQVIPITCPFKTVGKQGLNRATNAVLRDTIWQYWLVGKEVKTSDYLIFPNALSVPKKFYDFNYAVFVLDLASWHERSYLKWRGRVAVQALPEVLKSAAQIFAISDYTATDVAKEFGISLEQITVVPCGLSQSYKFDAAPIKTINNITLPAQYFLQVGTFEPKKNLSFLLQVYERFRELTANNSPPIKLVLTGGESWKSSDFFQQINSSKFAQDIIVLGRVQASDLPFLYRGAKALIFPSVFEGFGIPVIEALAQGTHVLINNNTSLSQFAQFGATVLPHFDADLWAKELIKFAQDSLLDIEYVSKVRNYFDWDRSAQIVAETIKLNV